MSASWHILLVDDEEEICEQVQEFLAGETFSGSDQAPKVELRYDFSGALEALEIQRFDLIILDVRLGEGQEDKTRGIATFERLRNTRFIPVIFYTALPRTVEGLETSLVRVVEKTAGLPKLLEEIRYIFDTRLPMINRALVRHIEKVQCDYMWTFVDEHWEQFGEEYDRADLAYFLARRISVSLSGLGIQEFVQNLEPPAPIANVVAENHVHPMQYYIIPPLKEAPPKCGDLFRGKIGEVDSYWMLLTPSCDLIKRGGNAKAEHVLLARCFKLSDEQEYTDLLEDLSNKTKKKHLRELLKNNRKSGQSERFYFLPGILNIPDQIADFQQLITLPYSHIEDLEHIASLDSPFSEAILARYARYTGRLGTPDLDIDVILERLFPEQQQ